MGGGISGLTAFYALAQARRDGAPVEEFLIEACDRAGGLIRTERAGDFVIEAGPDSFLTEKAAGIALAKELGLGDDLVGSCDEQRRTYILHRNRLVPLPAGLKLFVPQRLGPALTSPLFPFSSCIATLRERFLPVPGNEREDDEAVASFVRRHFGKGTLENIAAPLVAGIYGGDANQLSARSALPGLYGLQKQYGSLRRGVIKTSRNSEPARPLFTTLRGGMEQLVYGLVRSGSAGPGADRLRFGQRVTEIRPGGKASPPLAQVGSGRYIIHCQDGSRFEVDAVILALPAYECARLLGPVDAGLADALSAIPYAPAATVALAYSGCSPPAPSGFGFLAPRNSGYRLLACTFVHHKFPSRAPRGSALFRCFYGGVQDAEAARLDDHDLAALAQRELRGILGITTLPAFSRVDRWPLAMPQYVVGHEERIKKISAAMNKHPGLYLAGNAYSGVGISDCVRTAREAVGRVLRFAEETTCPLSPPRSSRP